MCLGEEHTRSVLEGMECAHCELFSLGKLRSRMSLFSRELGQSSAPRGSGPAAAEAARRLRSWGSQMELADEAVRGTNISRPSAADESELLEEDVLSLTSSDPAGSALLAHGQEWADEDEEDISEPSQPVCPAYDELLEVMERATARLDLQWRHEKGGVARSRLDERFLSGHNLPAPVSLPFLPDLHNEIGRHGKSHIQPASIGISIIIMLISRACVSMDMRRCPLLKRRLRAISQGAWHRR